MEWQPSQATARMAAGLRFDMTTPGDDMPTDDRSGLSDPNARAITTVFPYQLSFNLTNFGNNINGAMLTVNSTTAGTVVAFRGKPHNPSVVGLYRIDGKQARAAFAVHDRKLWIHDEPIDDARLAGNALRFSGLSPAQQAVSGLPAEGTLVFSDDGHTHRLEGCDVVGRRASADALAAPCASREAVAHPMVTAGANLVGDSDLSLTELANMTQFAFVQDPVSHNNVWVDAVQQATMNDFNQILLYYMPSDLRQTFYGQTQFNLSSAALQQIASMAPAGSDAGSWYQTLAVAFLTNVLSTWNEDGAAQLNALRAQAWLKSQTAISPVFKMQSAAMYALEWPNLNQNGNIGAYLADQVNQQAHYNTFIDADQAQWLSELQQAILDADSLQKMTDMVNNLVMAAKNNGLYWAYAFFRYITTPQALMEI